MVKNSYSIYVLLKNSIFFGEIFTIFYTFLHSLIKKKIQKFTNKLRPKVMIENFMGLKVEEKF